MEMFLDPETYSFRHIFQPVILFLNEWMKLLNGIIIVRWGNDIITSEIG